jgi:hypothetical protein
VKSNYQLGQVPHAASAPHNKRRRGRHAAGERVGGQKHRTRSGRSARECAIAFVRDVNAGRERSPAIGGTHP